MATQCVPGDIRDFILKHIASVAQIEALLLIWSNPEKRWSVSKVAARIYAGETETAKALEGLCANGLLVRKDDVFSLNASEQNVEMIGRLKQAYARHLIPVTDVIHGNREALARRQRRAGFQGIDEVRASKPGPGRGCTSGTVVLREAGGLAVLLMTMFTAQPSFAQKLYTATDDGSVLHDLCQRWFLFGRQGSEGARRTSELAPQEELCAYERSAERSALRLRQVAHIRIATRHSLRSR